MGRASVRAGASCEKVPEYNYLFVTLCRFKDLRELTDRIQRMSLSWQPRSLCGKFPPLL
ncbi:aluminum-activated malate transporter 14-like protein [Corchorus olitorius]|uniref:Aluminum-activated malate transporter 14-like protein n=1 Tax=Corchorus olitorius TaxID=93759 RepID=A0A1R3ITY1_9ROSI|nr:aluminum-activated malate transporter 14-like protein [Corchorus olitorius]OMO86027.1 aluminum-activated malate transporter 14-like protein [Corchorus olitorius]